MISTDFGTAYRLVISGYFAESDKRPDRRKYDMHNEIVSNQMRQRHLIGESETRFMMEHYWTALPRLWREKQSDVHRADPSDNLMVPLCVATENLGRRWYEAITSWMPAGLYAVAVCYATAVILMGWLPWNFLLLPPLLLGRNGHLRFREFETKRGSSL